MIVNRWEKAGPGDRPNPTLRSAKGGVPISQLGKQLGFDFLLVGYRVIPSAFRRSRIPIPKRNLLGRVVAGISALQGIVREIRKLKPPAHVGSNVSPKCLLERLLEVLKGPLRFPIYFDLHGVFQYVNETLPQKSRIETQKCVNFPSRMEPFPHGRAPRFLAQCRV